MGKQKKLFFLVIMVVAVVGMIALSAKDASLAYAGGFWALILILRAYKKRERMDVVKSTSRPPPIPFDASKPPAAEHFL